MRLGAGDKNRSLYGWSPLLPPGRAKLIAANAKSRNVVRVWAKTSDEHPLFLVHEVAGTIRVVPPSRPTRPGYGVKPERPTSTNGSGVK